MAFNESNKIIDPELSGLLTRKQPVVIPSAPKCPKCNKSVYKAEETRAANQIFHKLCFKCGACNKLLEPNNVTEHQGELFCKSCYAKNFGPKGYGYGGGAGILSMENGNNQLNNGGTNGTNGTNGTQQTHYIAKSDSVDSNTSPLSCSSTSSTASNTSLTQKENRKSSISATTMILGSTEKCNRCQKNVYMAEKVVAAGRSYHKLCFTCLTCKKTLNSMQCCDNSEGEIFCKACYSKQYGPKGVGYGIGAGTLKTN